MGSPRGRRGISEPIQRKPQEANANGQALNETFGSREGRGRKAKPRTRPSGPERDEAGRPSPERDLRVTRRAKPEGQAPNETFGSREGRSRKAEPRTRPSGHEKGEAGRPSPERDLRVTRRAKPEGRGQRGSIRQREAIPRAPISSGTVRATMDCCKAKPGRPNRPRSYRYPKEGLARSNPTGRRFKGLGFVSSQPNARRLYPMDRTGYLEPIRRKEQRIVTTQGRAPNETFGSREGRSRKAKPERDLRVPGRTKPEGRAPNETFGSREGRSRKAEPRTRPSGHERDEAGRPSPERDLRVPGGTKPKVVVDLCSFRQAESNRFTIRNSRETTPKPDRRKVARQRLTRSGVVKVDPGRPSNGWSSRKTPDQPQHRQK
jgi:hypothetical protein